MNAQWLAMAEPFDTQADSLRHTEREPKASVRAARVLVIEDERDLAMSLAKRLRHSGYEVDVAQDGVAATASAFRMPPDVVLLDIGLPGGDGFTVAERLRENPATCFTPVIFVTARTSEEDRARAENLGAFAYISKPFRSEDILGTVQIALNLVNRRERSRGEEDGDTSGVEEESALRFAVANIAALGRPIA